MTDTATPLDQVRDKLRAGQKVTPRELVDAEGRVRLDELAADVNAECKAEQERAARQKAAAVIVEPLRTGATAQRAARIVKLYDQAAALLRQLADETRAYTGEVDVVIRRLQAHGTMSPGVQVSDRRAISRWIEVDGHLYDVRNEDAEYLIAQLAYPTAPRLVGSAGRAGATSRAVIDRYREAVG